MIDLCKGKYFKTTHWDGRKPIEVLNGQCRTCLLCSAYNSGTEPPDFGVFDLCPKWIARAEESK